MWLLQPTPTFSFLKNFIMPSGKKKKEENFWLPSSFIFLILFLEMMQVMNPSHKQ